MKPIKTIKIGASLSLYALALAGTAFAQVAAPETAPVPAAQTSMQTSPETVKATITAPDPVKTTVAAKRTTKTEYRISREDALTITCLNAPEYNVSATVLPDGTISYPKMGQIRVDGKTLKQVETMISTFLKKEFVRPQVSVAVRERQIRQVALTGTGVKLTGKRVMRDGWTVRDAISDAGGLVSDRTDLFEGTLIRYETGTLIPLDLTSIYSSDASASNLLLEPNDTLIVNASDESKSQVLISGEVVRPGFVLIPRDHTISKALEAAGGVKTGTALLSEVIVERNGEKFPVDLRELTRGGTEPPLRLQPGDKLIVPENRRLIYMMGAAGRQGATLLPDDRPVTLIKAMADAGVQFNQAEVKKTQIIRQDEKGVQTVTVVNVEAMQKKADYSNDVILQPGDIIYVPYKGGRRFGVQDLVNNAFGISQLRTLLSPSFYRF